MIAWWHCTMRTQMTTWPLSLTSTLSERERALFRFFLCVSTSHLAHTHRGSINESFIPSTCSCSCERFSSLCSLFLLHELLAALLPFPPALEVRRQPAHSVQREYGLVWRVPPLQRFWAQRPRLQGDLSWALHIAPGLAAALLRQSVFCGRRLRWRCTRVYASRSSPST